MSSKEYIPGVCNIGPAEIRARKRTGWIGLIVTIIVLTLLVILNAPQWWRLILFFPATMSATGFIQGYSNFCVGFGMRGLFNFGSELGKTETVEQQEFRAKDKKKAKQIIAYSIAIGIVVAIVTSLA